MKASDVGGGRKKVQEGDGSPAFGRALARSVHANSELGSVSGARCWPLPPGPHRWGVGSRLLLLTHYG